MFLLEKMLMKRSNYTNAYEAILVDENGNITEGSKSNIFMIKDKQLITAPVNFVLPGITREIIIEGSKNIGYSISEENVNYKNIGDMDGLFISGTSPKVLPIRMVEKHCFNSSENDNIRKIMEAFDIKVENYILKCKKNTLTYNNKEIYYDIM